MAKNGPTIGIPFEIPWSIALFSPAAAILFVQCFGMDLDKKESEAVGNGKLNWHATWKRETFDM